MLFSLLALAVAAVAQTHQVTIRPYLDKSFSLSLAGEVKAGTRLTHSKTTTWWHIEMTDGYTLLRPPGQESLPITQQLCVRPSDDNAYLYLDNCPDIPLPIPEAFLYPNETSQGIFDPLFVKFVFKSESSVNLMVVWDCVTDTLSTPPQPYMRNCRGMDSEEPSPGETESTHWFPVEQLFIVSIEDDPTKPLTPLTRGARAQYPDKRVYIDLINGAGGPGEVLSNASESATSGMGTSTSASVTTSSGTGGSASSSAAPTMSTAGSATSGGGGSTGTGASVTSASSASAATSAGGPGNGTGTATGSGGSGSKPSTPATNPSAATSPTKTGGTGTGTGTGGGTSGGTAISTGPGPSSTGSAFKATIQVPGPGSLRGYVRRSWGKVVISKSRSNDMWNFEVNAKRWARIKVPKSGTPGKCLRGATHNGAKLSLAKCPTSAPSAGDNMSWYVGGKGPFFISVSNKNGTTKYALDDRDGKHKAAQVWAINYGPNQQWNINVNGKWHNPPTLN